MLRRWTSFTVLLSCLSACIEAPSVVTVDPPPPAEAKEIDTTTPSNATTPDASSTMTSPDASTPPAEDAAKPPIDPVKEKACSDAKGAFDGTTCTIACTATARCNDRKCPSGMPCKVTCTGQQACEKVDCGNATACDVRCEGYQACNGDVKAVEITSTTVTCDGIQACNGKVYCSGATCALTCTNGGCSDSNLSCCATACTLNGTITACP